MVPWSALQVDVPREMGKEANSKGKKEEKKEMKILILTGLVVIIVLLAFIAIMIYAIGDRLSQK
tara:strand:- start:115 stop:306 length:192 start_codon:yes stop_codon:yes gene_type:complete